MSGKTDKELEEQATAIMLAGFGDENAEPLSLLLLGVIGGADITRGGAICSLLVAALGVLGQELEAQGFDASERALILRHSTHLLVEAERHDQSSEAPPAGG